MSCVLKKAPFVSHTQSNGCTTTMNSSPWHMVATWPAWCRIPESTRLWHHLGFTKLSSLTVPRVSERCVFRTARSSTKLPWPSGKLLQCQGIQCTSARWFPSGWQCQHRTRCMWRVPANTSSRSPRVLLSRRLSHGIAVRVLQPLGTHWRAFSQPRGSERLWSCMSLVDMVHALSLRCGARCA